MIRLLPSCDALCLAWCEVICLRWLRTQKREPIIDELPPRGIRLIPANLLWLSLVTGNSTQAKEPAKASSMQEKSDEQLMTAVTVGDQVALAALVTRHHSPLLGYLYRLVGGDQQLAEDLVQETLLHVLRQRTYQADRPFKPWLYRIATNLARDYFKSAAVRKLWREGDEEEALLHQYDSEPSRKNAPWLLSRTVRCGRHLRSLARNTELCWCCAFIKASAYKRSLRHFASRWARSNRGSRWACTACGPS